MTTESSLPFEDRIREELAAAVREDHDVEDAAALARAILEKDTSQYELVGVRDHGPRAVFYDSVLRKIVSVPVGDSGIDGLDGDRVRDHSSQPDVDRWVFEQGEAYWSWLHPRFAWVFG